MSDDEYNALFDDVDLSAFPDDAHDSSSLLHTPPSVVYDNLTTPSQPQARALRREPSGLVDCHRVLTKIFGHQSYKGKQREIVEAAVRGADVFVLAPTGMGKSLCFQVPAVAETHGITIVVSPLLALMKNQVAGLRAKSVKVVALTSETPTEEREELLAIPLTGYSTARLALFDMQLTNISTVTPEKLLKGELLHNLDILHENKELNRLVIDEAHCISEWGHDFRSEYRRLGIFRDRYKSVPIMALTATATPAVQADIIRSLGISTDHLVKVVHPFNRGNLFYEVKYMSTPNQLSQFAEILKFIMKIYERRGRVSSGIIYCRTRAACDELSIYLRGQGLRSRPYHRGLKPHQLDTTLREWTGGGGAATGTVDVVCATIAFGLGIDKGDVRYIIHYDLPKSLEGYYQETGRAGRDGSPAKCILFYSREDAIRLKRLVAAAQTKRTTMAMRADGPEPSQRSVDSLKSLIDFAESTTVCRHVAICRYFGEPIDEKDTNMVRKYCNKMCDICKNPDKTKAAHKKLSTEEFAATQVPLYPPRDEDADHHRSREEGNSEWNSKRRGDSAALKRARTDVDNAALMRYGKKGKTSAGGVPMTMRSLNTMPFASHSVLKKPFKTPSMASSSKAPRNDEENAPPAVARPPDAQQSVLEISDDEDDRPLSPVGLDEWRKDPASLFDDEEDLDEVQSHNSRESSPMDLSEPGGQVEAHFSQKILLSVRQDAQEDIRKAFHKAFLRGSEPELDKLWKVALGKRQLDPADRPAFVDDAAKAAEFAAFSMCSTEDGYTVRVQATVAGLWILGKNKDKVEVGGPEEEWEDAMDMLALMQDVH
ncbi:ATP-dependent DNA helicase [Mycena chlorophos]|uniref:ATP-dependent DNA helicase n=1 Tax=Mycena chlorophos TaxID=658473 RepID=A0A8H6W1I4_MYCCL|nr:ATP-dependent DNA helicase [Mycena chlorophos]